MHAMEVLNLVAARLSEGLNRPHNVGLAQAVVRFHQSHGDENALAAYLAVLGLKDGGVAAEVYRLVRENETELAAELAAASAEPAVEPAAEADKALAVLPARPQPRSQPRPPPRLQLDFDEPVRLAAPKRDAPRPAFKKIKKEDARRIKEEARDARAAPDAEAAAQSAAPRGDAQGAPDAPALSDAPTLAQLAQRERAVASAAAAAAAAADAAAAAPAAHLAPADLENDREWYTAEEFGHVAQDYDDYDGATSTAAPAPARPRDRRTGGGFDATGEYVDFDHEPDGAAALSRVPIVAHFLVPPFLRDSAQHLAGIEFGEGRSRTIGPMIDPVRDPASELAVAARQGSAAVRERQLRAERAKLALEGVGRSRVEDLAPAAPHASLAAPEASPTAALAELATPAPPGTEAALAAPPESEAALAPPQPPAAARRTLPVFAVRTPLLHTILENQVTIVVGETGSGKTTQLTQYLAEEGYCAPGAMVGCTQPRRVAAMLVAQRVSAETGTPLGAAVGYLIRFEDRTCAATVIKYMTEGILLREILADPLLSRYRCIIMDEAHERLLNTDVLLGLFRTTVLPRRRDLKLVVTSATMNSARFARFFGGAPQFAIPGRTFPVDVLYLRGAAADYVEAAAKQVVSIHLLRWLAAGHSDGDVLVFMTGQEDIEATAAAIAAKLALLDAPPPLDVLPIYSTMPQDLQQRIFRAPQRARRKCIVATNIAETSLTVDGIRYVVDSGLCKLKVYNAKLGMDTLQVVPILRANADQRSGRAGRTAPGTAFRLYTERAAAPAHMYPQPVPEIQRTNLSNVALMLKLMRVAALAQFPFLDPPPPDLMSCALYELWSIGALAHGGELTPLGREMSALPMEPTLAKLLLLLPRFGCVAEVVTVVAMLLVPPCYYRPRERAAAADAARAKFAVPELDHLTLLNVFRQWAAVPPPKRAAWCARNFLHPRSLARASDIRLQLVALLARQRISAAGGGAAGADGGADDDRVRRCLCAAFFQQAARLVRLHPGAAAEYVNLRHAYMRMFLHPTSALNGELAPPYVVYHELILTNREYMSCATAVDPLWLLEFGAVFYGVSAATAAKIRLAGGRLGKSREELEQEMGGVEQVEREVKRVKTERTAAARPRRGF